MRRLILFTLALVTLTNLVAAPPQVRRDRVGQRAADRVADQAERPRRLDGQDLGDVVGDDLVDRLG